jgi:hypothetical protein
LSSAADKQINGALRRFGEAQEGARRFHGELIGKHVNPDYCFGDFLLKVATNQFEGIRKTYGDSLDREFGPGGRTTNSGDPRSDGGWLDRAAAPRPRCP